MKNQKDRIGKVYLPTTADDLVNVGMLIAVLAMAAWLVWELI